MFCRKAAFFVWGGGHKDTKGKVVTPRPKWAGGSSAVVMLQLLASLDGPSFFGFAFHFTYTRLKDKLVKITIAYYC